VLENRVLRRIFGPKREEETGGWRKLRYEELHNLYSSADIISVIRSISLYSSEILHKKELFGEVGTVYLVQYKNSPVTMNALWNSCEDMACCSSVQ
jgi:hypothetical protein